ncbi:N-acetylglutamate synthase [Hortaea werneckii]|nr:N-acetylglutamate synthase [Hortaea werneckii]
MITSTLAFGKANASGSLKPAVKHLKVATTRNASSATAAAHNGNGNGNGRSRWSMDDPIIQRELFMDVLSANATKRDAKQYLARFKKPQYSGPQAKDVQAERNARHRNDQDRLERIGVNLGGLYAPSRAIADTPQFTRQHVQEKAAVTQQQTLHMALVCLKAPETLDDEALEGLALTLAQLVKLDMRIVLVMDLGSGIPCDIRERRTVFAEQAERLLHAVRRHSPAASRFITGAIEASENSEEPNLNVPMPKLLMEPLKRGIIPVIPSLAYTPSGKLICADSGDVMAALAKQMSQQSSQVPPDAPATTTSLDRVIVLDPAGGIPSRDRGDHAHVFINLQQEYDEIEDELSQYTGACTENTSAQTYQEHKANLRMLNDCLAMLPSASSGLIISPHEAATSSRAIASQEPTLGAGTRRQKNTLIHNLLTNKPMVSSSLPTARLPSAQTNTGEVIPTMAPAATLVKRGMPLTIVPAADRARGWTAPENGRTSLDLRNDSRIDLPRLVHLINDSFRRELDVDHYLNRIHSRVAGLIIAGNYEGGAILTWEASRDAPHDPTRLVPYLDKFAVLQSSQGSSGVADILFQAMVRSCFPEGVCWRSRKDNPVNKWYFERAAGSWQIPGTNWTMFWTGKGIAENEQRWRDYVSVCESVQPSWADGKRPD